MSFPRYPKYKDSTVDWLGEVPEGWRVIRMGMLEKSGDDFVSGPFGSSLGSSHYVESGIPVIRGLNTTLNAEARFVPEDFVFVGEETFSELKRCDARPDDLVFTARGTVGKVGIVPDSIPKALISPNQLRYRPDLEALSVDYLFYLFSSSGLLSEIALIADSVAQPNLNLGNLKALRVSLPPKDEQTEIAAFLDRETAKIDELVAEQRRLVELLKEKRQAVVSHAVTQGLNPDAPMKSSGIEWLGDVPAHWRVGNARWLTRRYSGGTPDKTNLAFWEDGTIPWLNSGAVNDRLIVAPSTYITAEAFANSSAKWIPEGALVMALAGQGKTKGMVAQLAIPSTCNQSMAAIIPGPEIIARFLFWWLESNYQNIRNMAGGDLRDGLNLELLGDIPCPLAPLSEQIEIAAFLDLETAKMDGLVAGAQRAIELLQERRNALISAAVTGQIDVRQLTEREAA